MLIYAASPIDKSPSLDDLWVSHLAAELHKQGTDIGRHAVIYDPSHTFSVIGYPLSQPVAHKLVSVNEAVLLICDVLVVRYLNGIESWGVPMELDLAHRHLKPILAVTASLEMKRVALNSIYFAARVPPANIHIDLESLASHLWRLTSYDNPMEK